MSTALTAGKPLSTQNYEISEVSEPSRSPSKSREKCSRERKDEELFIFGEGTSQAALRKSRVYKGPAGQQVSVQDRQNLQVAHRGQLVSVIGGRAFLGRGQEQMAVEEGQVCVGGGMVVSMLNGRVSISADTVQIFVDAI